MYKVCGLGSGAIKFYFEDPLTDRGLGTAMKMRTWTKRLGI